MTGGAMVNPPPLIDVLPGDPITSEGWNNMLATLRLLVGEANQRRGTVTVNVVGPGNIPFRGAAVTAQPQGDPVRPPRAAAFVGAGVDAYQFDQMLPGSYALSVEAEGFSAQTQTPVVVVAADADPPPATFTLVPTVERFAVPNVLGIRLDAALSAIKAAGFAAGRVIDSHGVELAPGNVPEEAQGLPVLGQFPIADSLEPKTDPIFVHVSATSEVLKRVKVPDLRGLTMSEAKDTLESLGLALGPITTVGS
jgi:hypothetical protein